MIWRVTLDSAAQAARALESPAGRYVIHRHVDAAGPHRDLRIEWDGYLLGWRIEGEPFGGEAWAVEKGPHPTAWLDRDGDAVREEAGTYAWIERTGDARVIALRGAAGDRVFRIERAAALTPALVARIAKAARDIGIDPADAARLMADGARARERAIARLCGLGRELDGPAFDEPVWRRTLASLALDDIHRQLRLYESRFDAKYPPQPVSRPETLPGEDAQRSPEDALAILRT